MKHFLLTILSLFCLLLCPVMTLFAQESQPSQPARFVIDAGTVQQQIDEKVYGHFLEHIYHSVNGGLWGELIWNRSFEDNMGGGWKQLEEGVIAQTGLDTDQRLYFGDVSWDDYEFSVQARKTGGEEGFLILFRAQNKDEFYWVNLGGWGNQQHAIERKTVAQDRQGVIGKMQKGRIRNGKWYTITVRCEGPKITVLLDGETLLEVVDETGPRSGQVGIGTWATQAEFRNFCVKSLDGQTLYEEMPELPDTKAGKSWEVFVFDDFRASLEEGDARNGNVYQKISLREKGLAFLLQKGLSLRKDESYLVSFWYKLERDETVAPEIAVLFKGDDAESGVAESGVLAIPSGSDVATSTWRKWEGTLSGVDVDPDKIDSAGLIIIIFNSDSDSPVTLSLDQVSVMPKSWLEQHGGMRPDLLNAIAELRPPTIRWPGGCFASAYRWKSGIGPQDDRVPYPFSIWDDRDVNSFGTDEFIELCRRVQTEPIIVINAGTPNWNVKRDAALESVDWVEEAAHWVEYCNGSVETKWGKIRAENGHPDPYNVKYWEIDNEVQGGIPVEKYIEMVRKIVPAMKKVDPNITILVSGAHYEPREVWDRPIVEQAGELFDYISFHMYDDPNHFVEGPKKIGNYFRQLQKIIAKSNNPNIKIFDSEWNAQSTDWRTGLYAGGILNEFERCSDILEIGGPALFLRHVSAKDWDNAFVNFDATSWFPAPNYVVMKLWRDHYAPNLLKLTGSTESSSLDVVATKTGDGSQIIVKMVNRAETPQTVELCVENVDKRDSVDKENRNKLGAGKAGRGSAEFKSAKLQTVSAGLSDRNTLKEPNKIRPKEGTVAIENGVIQVVLPSYSANVLVLE